MAHEFEKVASALRTEMDKRRMNVRQLAQELEMSSATITRILAALPADLTSLNKVCTWMKVELVDVLEQKPWDAELARLLIILFEREPELKAIFSTILEKIENDEMAGEDLRDIAEYATFILNRLQQRRRN